MSIDWQQQVCLITGASGGIGEAIARKLAGLGASLILTGRNGAKLSELLESLPGRHTVACADITTAEGLDFSLPLVMTVYGPEKVDDDVKAVDKDIFL